MYFCIFSSTNKTYTKYIINLQSMNYFNHLSKLAIMGLMIAPTLVSCSDDSSNNEEQGGGLKPLTPTAVSYTHLTLPTTPYV